MVRTVDPRTEALMKPAFRGFKGFGYIYNTVIVNGEVK